jgi:hypothetical protein
MKKKILLYSIKSVLLVGIFLWVARFAHHQTDGFALWKIRGSFPVDSRWNTSDECWSTIEQAKEMLDQPYTYFSRGVQCYAFLSQDQNYVIKFLKMPRFFAPKWTALPIFQGKARKLKKRYHEKLTREFTSYKIAYEQLREETGLLFLHLNPTRSLGQKMTIVDKLGIRHQINLDETLFILQRKADLALPTLDRLVKSGNLSSAQAAIDKLFAVLNQQLEKNIVDLDPNFTKNFGFIDNRAIQIDIGRLEIGKIGSKEHFRQLERTHDAFKAVLDQHLPDLADHFEELYQAFLDKISRIHLQSPFFINETGEYETHLLSPPLSVLPRDRVLLSR